MKIWLERYGPVWAPEGPSGGSSAPTGSSGGGGSAPSSGAPAPSSSPSSPSGGADASRGATPSPTTGSPAGAGEAPSFDYGAMFGDGLPVDVPLETTTTTPAPVAAPPPPAAAPVAPPATAAPVAEAAPVVAPVEAPQAQGGAPVGGPPQAAQAPAALDPYNPGMLAEHLSRSEGPAIDFVAEQMFKLSQPEIEAIEQDVIGQIPKLLAKVFVKSQQNVLQQLDRMIPTMMQRHTEAMKRNGMGEDKFYAAWPGIGREYKPLVDQYANVYRQMHPQATLDDLIRDVGPIVMMAARIPVNAAGAGQVAGQSPPAANGRPPQPAPFTPAGGGPVSQSKSQELNPWEAMFVGRE